MGEHCESCPYRDVSGAIGTSGNIEAPIAIVGEAPGANEIRSGTPFIGQAGKLLDKVLTRAGIERGDCYVTNSMLCRPTESPPPRSAIDACRGRLANELRAAPRTLILAFGNSALRSITGNHALKISHERGKVIETPFGRVLPTYHPAAILRGYSDFPKLLADVTYGASLANGDSPKNPGKTKWVLVTEDNIARAVKTLLKRKYLGADIETTGFNSRQDRILVMGVAWAPNKVAIFPEEILTHPMFRKLLDDEGPRWVWHNGKFDTAFLQSMGFTVARVDEDTMLMHYALDETRGTHDLKQLASDLLGAPDYSGVLKQYVPKMSDSFENVPRRILFPYCAADCDNTYQLLYAMAPRLDNSLRRLYRDVLIPASAFLRKVEARGMWVNREYLDNLATEFYARRDRELQAVYDILLPVWNAEQYAREEQRRSVPKELNAGSPLQLRWALSKLLKRRIPNTTADTLKHLPRVPIVKALLAYRKTDKAITTYIEGVRSQINDDGRVHSTYLIHGTTTGRLSSRGPNMQNIPRPPLKGESGPNVRNMFQAPKGRTLVELDYSQIELRVLAYFSGDKFLRDVYIKGRDLHDEVAVAMFGPDFNKEQRIRAKFVNFGIAYGRGAGSIAHEFNIPFPEAQQMISAWFARAPEAASYIRECRNAPLTGKILETPFGRRRRFGLVTRENLNALQNEAVNFPMQSTASDLTLTFAMKIDIALRSNWGAGIVNLVHDSILIEVPESADIKGMVDWVSTEMTRHPQEILETDLPFAVSVAYGRRWGDLK